MTARMLWLLALLLFLAICAGLLGRSCTGQAVIQWAPGPPSTTFDL